MWRWFLFLHVSWSLIAIGGLSGAVAAAPLLSFEIPARVSVCISSVLRSASFRGIAPIRTFFIPVGVVANPIQSHRFGA